MIWVTSDLHGFSHERFVRFLEDSGFSGEDELYVLGDVIDRNGDGGVETLQWIMSRPNVHFLLGNHEDMLLKCAFLFEGDGRKEDGLDLNEAMRLMNWLENGADATIRTLRKQMDDAPEKVTQILRFLEDAPLYKQLEVAGKKYFLSHAGLGHYEKEKSPVDYDTDDLLWFRPELGTVYEGDMTFIFGHTPVAAFGPEYGDRMLRTDTWIDIDTGAAHGRKPMLLRLEDEKAFYLE